MAPLFVAGVTKVWRIGLIAVLVLLEKVAPRGLIVGKIADGLLVLWGVWMLAKASG